MLGNVCIWYSMFVLTAVHGYQSINNKLIKHFSNCKYIYSILYCIGLLLMDVRKCLYLIFYVHADCCAGVSENLFVNGRRSYLFSKLLWIEGKLIFWVAKQLKKLLMFHAQFLPSPTIVSDEADFSLWYTTLYRFEVSGC